MYGGSGAGLYRVSATGGVPERLIRPDPEEGRFDYRNPQVLPNGKDLLFSVRVGFTDFKSAVLSLETGEQKILLENGRQAHYTSTGHLVYGQSGTGTLMAAPFDLASLEVTGAPSPVLEGVRHSPNSTVTYALSEVGTLVYISGNSVQQRSLVWVNRSGESQTVTEIQRNFADPRLSPDGEQLALTVSDDQGSEVWSYNIARGTLTPLTFDGNSYIPVWTPDGKRLAFHTHRTREDIFWMSADGTGEAEQLTTSEAVQTPHSWSPDGALAYTEGPVNQRDIWVVSTEGAGERQSFLATQFNEKHAMFSPDGHWIAFTSNQSGQDEVYVKPYPVEGGIVQISTSGGSEPLWARSGRELFYRNGKQMMVVEMETGPALKVSIPRLLFEGDYGYSSPDFASNYDVSPDGQRFLMIKQAEPVPTQINVVLNWFEELKRLVPTDN